DANRVRSGWTGVRGTNGGGAGLVPGFESRSEAMLRRASFAGGVCLVTSTCLMAAGLAGATSESGWSGPMVALVHREHPRLLLSSGAVADLRRELPRDSWLAESYRREKNRADRILTDSVSRYELAGETGLLATSR